MDPEVIDAFGRNLKALAERANSDAVRKRDDDYLRRRTVAGDRDFLIACRHWNSSTPVIPRPYAEHSPYARLASYGLGGGYFLTMNGVGVAVDPGYGFINLLYGAYGFTICDIDAVFITHDHPDHWADLANILVLKNLARDKNDTESVEPAIYLGEALAGLRGFLSPSDLEGSVLRRRQVVTLHNRDGDVAARVTALPAYHNERLVRKRNSPYALGFHFQIEDPKCDYPARCQFPKCPRPGLRSIAIAGDTQFPDERKRKNGISEFTAADRQAFVSEYESVAALRRQGDCKLDHNVFDVLSMHIGSIEKEIAHVPSSGVLDHILTKAFYPGYHLGFAGCLRMLNSLFTGQHPNNKLAILTEFGEELRGNRVDIATVLERAAVANSGDAPLVRVVPADIGMAVQLNWHNDDECPEWKLRCNRCLRMREAEAWPDKAFDPMAPDLFHPRSKMDIYEDLDTGLIQYCCHW